MEMKDTQSCLAQIVDVYLVDRIYGGVVVRPEEFHRLADERIIWKCHHYYGTSIVKIVERESGRLIYEEKE